MRLFEGIHDIEMFERDTTTQFVSTRQGKNDLVFCELFLFVYLDITPVYLDGFSIKKTSHNETK